MAGSPEAFLGRDLMLEGVISVLKKDSQFLSASGATSLGAYVTFKPGWQDRSPAQAVRLLAKLRRKSRMRFPEKGVTMVELDFKNGIGVFEGRLTSNPDYQPAPGPNASLDAVVNYASGGRRLASRYRFEVERIVKLKEHHWPNRPPN